jgi:hypothetical protein
MLSRVPIYSVSNPRVIFDLLKKLKKAAGTTRHLEQGFSPYLLSPCSTLPLLSSPLMDSLEEEMGRMWSRSELRERFRERKIPKL